jgi:hypothetical protein
MKPANVADCRWQLPARLSGAAKVGARLDDTAVHEEHELIDAG